MSKSGIPIVQDVAKAAKPIVQPIAKAIRPLAPILPFIPIPGMFGLSSLLTRSLLAGALGGLDKQGKFNVGRGIKTGLLSYGIGSLLPSAAAANGSAAAPMSAADFGSAVDSIDAAAGTTLSGAPAVAPSAVDAANAATYSYAPTGFNTGVAGAGPVPTGAPTTFAASGQIPTVDVTGGEGFERIGGAAPITSVEGTGLPGVGAGTPAPSTAQSMANLAGATADTATTAAIDAAKYVGSQAIKNPIQTASLALTGYGAIKSKEELDRQKEEAERILRNRENEKQERIAYAQSVLREYPLLYRRLTEEDVRSMGLASGGMTGYDDEPGYDYAYGGLAGLANGGLPPRYLRGGGDGMSDSIPARIAGRQEARLADGEFVVPADVVSHIGNGSSNAGAKKLYAMMDRARQARTGNKRQAPAVKAERYMPA